MIFLPSVWSVGPQLVENALVIIAGTYFTARNGLLLFFQTSEDKLLKSWVQSTTVLRLIVLVL